MNDDDQIDSNDDFLSAMGDVKPLAQKKRAPVKHRAEMSPGQERRRQAAEAEEISDSNILSGGGAYTEAIEPLDPQAVLEFKRDGVQNGVYRSLRLGKYQIEARLDLHHTTVEQARAQVFQFVRDCREHHVRCALITHGKGEGRKQPARLKSCVAHWLPQLDEVLAFHSAQQHHGGTGATYIMLRKSEEKRLQNMEEHAKRRR